MKTHTEDGKTAILISPGFGAGWSTWNSEHSRFFLMDSGLVALVMADADETEIEAYCKQELGKPDDDFYIYLGGLDGLVIKWLPNGTKFCVDEYDGSESICTIDNLTEIAGGDNDNQS